MQIDMSRAPLAHHLRVKLCIERPSLLFNLTDTYWPVIEFINATRVGVKPQGRSVEISRFVGCEGKNSCLSLPFTFCRVDRQQITCLDNERCALQLYTFNFVPELTPYSSSTSRN
jgi:hypothetical protein